MTDKKGYLGNPNLRREFRKREYTTKELAEMLKCAQDIEYFAEHFCYIVTLDKGKQLIELYDYQKEMLKLMTGETILDEKYNIVTLAPRQCGKCITGNTKINIMDNESKTVFETTIEDFHELLKKINTNEPISIFK